MLFLTSLPPSTILRANFLELRNFSPLFLSFNSLIYFMLLINFITTIDYFARQFFLLFLNLE